MSLVTVDQGLSSLSNLLALVVVAHVLEPADFGRFSLLFLAYTIGQAAVRASVSVPVLVHPADAMDSPRAPLGSALLLGGAAGAVCLLVGIALTVFGSALGTALLVLGVCLPFLLVHDVGRYLAFARTTPGRAIVLDSLWLVLSLGGFLAAERTGRDQLWLIVLAWAGSGAVAALWVLVQYGVPRGRDLGTGWLRQRWAFVWRNVASSVAAQGVGLAGATAAAAVSTPVTVAVVRASLLLGRPSATVQAGVGASTAADVARERPADGGHALLRRALVISVGVGVANLALLLLLPDAVGRLVLGGVWPLVEPLLLPVGLFSIAAAFHSSVQAVFVGRHDMGRVLRLETAGAVVSVACLVGGAAYGGASGALWGTTAGQAIASLGWMSVYLHQRRSGRRPRGRHAADRGRAARRRQGIPPAA